MRLRVKILTTFLLLLSVSATMGQGQVGESRDMVWYPLNVPYTIWGRYMTSFEIQKKNSNDHLLFGLHFNRNLGYYFDRGSGFGIEYQHRLNFNRDTNVIMTRNAYWGPMIEIDGLQNETYDFNGTQTVLYNDKIRMYGAGVLGGFNRIYKNGNRADIYLGVGLASYTHSRFSNEVLPFVKVGIQYGFKMNL